MASPIAPDAWVRFVDSEYLASYVSDGGAAIKFAVPLEDEARDRFLDAITATADRLGYLTVTVRADETKVHMPDQLVFRIADQVPWRDLSRAVLQRLATRAGYEASVASGGAFVEELATANDIDPSIVALQLRRTIAEDVYKRRGLAKDFRIAMTQLCLAELGGGADSEVTASVLRDWLTGRALTIGAVKPYQIFNRINRANARHMFGSLLHWVRYAGMPGTLVILDISRLTVPRNPRDGSVFYTKAALLDAYEVLRQFIDGTDRLEGCLIVAVADPAFLDDDPLSRGMGAYEALKFRIYDEVRDRHLPNPLASLVRISTDGTETET